VLRGGSSLLEFEVGRKTNAGRERRPDVRAKEKMWGRRLITFILVFNFVVAIVLASLVRADSDNGSGVGLAYAVEDSDGGGGGGGDESGDDSESSRGTSSEDDSTTL
jgi:hypothetical protein